MKGFSTIYRSLIIILILVSIGKQALACVGGPSINGSTSGLSRTPVWTRCYAFSASDPPSARALAVSVSANNTLTSYTIIWGDGKADSTGASLASGSTIGHTYDTLGVYTIKIISNVGGCIDTVYGTINNISPPRTSIKPLATDPKGCAPLSIDFTDETNFAFPGTTLTWTFGDGTTVVRGADSANKSVTHTWVSGSITQCTTSVTLTATNTNCPLAAQSYYTIGPVTLKDKDKANIGLPGLPYCNASRTYTFTDASTINCPSEHLFRYTYWDFGDGTNTGWLTSPPGSVTHTFPDTGSYTITLKDSNDCGLDVVQRTFTVNISPLAGFIAAPKMGCAPLTVNFSDTSLGLGNTRSWTFTGTTPTSSTSATPSRTYSTAGKYAVKLSVTNACGTNGPAIDTIYVYDKPQVFIGGLKNGCAPLTVTLKDSTKRASPNATYFWSFGNGQTSTSKNPTSFQYTTAGSYTVKLIVTDTCGKDSITKTIRVDSVPTANFSASTVCKFDSTVFDGSSSVFNTGDTITYKWYYGTSPIDSSKTTSGVKYRYAGSGYTYRSILKVTTTKGCFDYDTQTVSVKISPSLVINNNPSTMCEGQVMTFTGDTTGSGSVITSFQWTFGGLTTDTARVKDTSYQFPSAGTYSVKFSASNGIGCSNTVSKSITVNPIPDAKPTSSIGCLDQNTQFKDSSTVGFSNTITQWAWDFNNDGVTDSTTQNPFVKFASFGTFKVKLKVGTNNNCFNTDSVNVTVYAKPIMNISSNSNSLCKLDSFIFSNATTGASSFQWTFGDGTDSITSSTNSIHKSYLDTGFFAIKMIATTVDGCKDSSSLSINSRPHPVSIFTTNDTIGCAPKLFTFSNNSILADSYKWLMNGTQTTTATTRPDTTIVQPGQMVEIKLIATNVYGCKPDTAVTTIYTFGNPVPDFTMSTDSGCGPLSVNFFNTTTGASNFFWYLGNDSTASTTDASDLYFPSAINDSIYTIKLIALNGPGCSDSISKTVRVFPKPISSFTQDATAGCGPFPVNFTNTSVHKYGGNIDDLQFDWSFGNGGTSNSKNTQQAFNASTIRDTVYTTQLIATTLFGCKDTSTATSRVYPNATSLFYADKTDGCAPLSVNFTNGSIPNDTGNISIMSFAWSFANGNTAATQNTSNTFLAHPTKDTIYNVQLIAYSEHGCPDTSYKPIRVYPKPLSSFTPSDSAGCGPLSVSFTNNSLPYDTGSISIMSFIWDFGNGFNSVATQPNGLFLAKALVDTVYHLNLVAISEHNCRDTSYKDLRVHPKPVVGFTTDKNAGCGPLNIQFTNISQLGSTYSWIFGDGDTSTQENPTHAFASYPLFDSVYAIKFTTQSIFGCQSDTAQTNITARFNPVSDFFASKDSICTGETITFYNASTGGSGYQWDFANGQTATTINPSSSFVGVLGSDSTYSIRLVTTSPYQCRDTAYKSIRVTPPPATSVTTILAEMCKLDSFTFTNNTTGGASYEWRFGDGSGYTTNSLNSFNKAYIDSGKYTVRVVSTSPNGCRDTANFDITSRPFPIARFTINDSAACAPHIFTFANTSLISNSYKWLINGTQKDTSTILSDTLVSQPGQLFQVKLIAQNIFGCRPDTVVKSIRTFSNPVPDFTLSADSGCGPLAVSLSNNTSGGYTYQWDLGNGATSASIHATTNYVSSLLNDSLYTIKLIAFNQSGCSDSISKTVKTFPTPVADFTLDKDADCGPAQITFTNASTHKFGGTINDMSFQWNFANGQTSTAKDTTSIFTASKIQDTLYHVKLVASSRFGCKDSALKQVRVYPNAKAQFTASSNDGCGPLLVNFNNISVPNDTGNITIMTFTWDFLNGSTSTQQNPSQTFIAHPTKDTIYSVKLIAYSEHGCSDTITKPIRVYPNPVSDFSMSDTAGCGPLNVSFTNSSIPNDTGTIAIMSFVWDLGNGFNSVNKDVSSQYVASTLSDGLYSVKLIASSEHGCKDTSIQSIRVHPKPIIGFTTNKTQGCGPLDINFTNTTQLGSIYTWNFGDGDTSSSASPSHTYQSFDLVDSIYPVSMSALSAYGCVSDTAVTNIIARYSPIADFSPSSDSICGSGNILFFNSSMGGNSNAWSFGNGVTSTSYNPSSSFNAVVGRDTSYTVQLVVTSLFQCRDTAHRDVKINYIPDATFASVTPGCTPLSVTFNNQSQYAERYEWELGEPNIDTTSQPNRVFTNSLALTNRNYAIILKAYSRSGCLDTAKRNITVYPKPVTSFSASKNLRCDTAQFTMLNNTIGADTYSWNFGDNRTENGYAPTHYYRTAQNTDTTYHISLLATSTDGCKDSTNQSIVVKPLIDANFTAATTSSCSNLDVQFANLSRNSISYFWTFGDGSGTSSSNPSHKYNNTGSYKVTMIAFNAEGCSDTSEKVNYVNIHETPTANFLVTPQRIELPDATAIFTNVSFINEGTLAHDWNFGETSKPFNTSSLKDPQHKYADTGNYIVTLIVTSNYNCADTFTRNVIVNPPLPVASFDYDPASGCVPHKVNFTNKSTYATTFSWNFGDAANSTQKDPSHTYTVPGTYNVYLRAEGPGGIDDTTQMQIITVYPQPIASFIAAPLNVYLPNGTVDFTNTSYDNDKNQWTLFKGDDVSPYWQDSSENTSYQFKEEGNFSVQLIVMSPLGCLDTLMRYEAVTVNRGGTLFVPNVFTPNGDNTNEIFIPLHTGLIPEKYSFKIYDRWGLKVFETDNVKEGWNGNIYDQPAMSETYIWIIEGAFTGGNEFTKKGQVTLLR